MRVSIIIPNFNGAHFLAPCLDSVFNQSIDGHEIEVIIVENASTDGSIDLIRDRFSECCLIVNDTNLGFTPAINQGAKTARWEWLLLLNNDTELMPDSLKVLFDHASQANANTAGFQPLLLWAKDSSRIDSAGIAMGPRFRARDDLHGESIAKAPTEVKEIWGVCGGCALIRKADFEAVGGFDHDFFAEWDDVDFCLQLRWLSRTFELIPEARVLHHRSPTSNKHSSAKQFRHHRNQLWSAYKALPGGMRARHLFYCLQRDIFMIPSLIRKGRFGSIARSWIELLSKLSVLRGQRKRLLQQATRSHADLRNELNRFMSEDG